MRERFSAVKKLLADNKKFVAIIVGVLVVVTGLFFIFTSPQKGTLGYEARHQQVAPKKAMKQLIADQQAGKKNEKANTTIFVFYRNDCSVCKREGKRIIKMVNTVKKQSTGNVTVTYVNAKHGIPNWFKEHYGLVLGDVKTPYVFELRSDLYETHNATKDNVKFYPVARGRLVNKDTITYAQSSLISGSQLQRNQIYQLDNINNSVDD